MITKERLQELITLNKPFWYVYDNSILKTINAKYWKIVDDKICWYADSSLYRPFENLFENKEEAEWYLEFGNITRTETLSLPTWEEFKKNKRFIFISAGHTWYEISIFKKKIFLNFIDDEFWTDYEDWKPVEATKENYLKCCELCRKLFLGEDVEEL